MQISFDPLAQQEAAAVRAMLDALHAQQVGCYVTKPLTEEDRSVIAKHVSSIGGSIAAVSDTPFQTMAKLNDALAPSAAPLDPAPSTAAADLFSIAPVAPPATSATIVPTPPVPSAPIPPAPPAPATSASPAGVDSTGLPWDERIHSGTKAVNADGTWRARRGLNNPALVKEVEAELRQLAGIPVSAGPSALGAGAAAPGTSQQAVESISGAASATAPVEVIPAPPTIPVPPTPPIVLLADHGASTAAATSDVPNAATTTSAPPTAPIPSPPAPDAAPQAPSAPVTFGALMTTLIQAVTTGSLTTEQVKDIVSKKGGVPNGEMGKLATMPDKVQLVAAEVARLQGV